MSALVALSVVILVAAVWSLSHRRRRFRNLPPSPPGWPVIGNLLDVIKNPTANITKWNRKYGPAIAVRFGPRMQIVLSDDETIRTVFSDERSTGRDHDFGFARVLQRRGLLTSEGHLWKEHRRFALSRLRDLGMGKTWMEDAILDEVRELNDLLLATNGGPVDPRPHLTLAVFNVICAMLCGTRFEHSDERLQRFCGVFSENLALIGQIAPVQAFHWLKHTPEFAGIWKRIERNAREVRVFVKDFVRQHRERSSSRNEDKSDYINCFLEEQARQKSNPLSAFDDEQLFSSVIQLLAAGTETTSSTLLWAFVFMSENPDVLAGVQQEIDSHIGRDRPIRMSDKALLKYTDAVLLEVQRLGSVLPFGVPHATMGPMKIDGYDVPARTIISTNSYMIHRDPKYWTNPERFDPLRFIAPDGSIVIPKGFLPFGVGKRACLGESLAKMKLHLFFCNILQKCHVRLAPGSDVSAEKAASSMNRTPQLFKACFIPR